MVSTRSARRSESIGTQSASQMSREPGSRAATRRDYTTRAGAARGSRKRGGVQKSHGDDTALPAGVLVETSRPRADNTTTPAGDAGAGHIGTQESDTLCTLKKGRILNASSRSSRRKSARINGSEAQSDEENIAEKQKEGPGEERNPDGSAYFMQTGKKSPVQRETPQKVCDEKVDETWSVTFGGDESRDERNGNTEAEEDLASQILEGIALPVGTDRADDCEKADDALDVDLARKGEKACVEAEAVEGAEIGNTTANVGHGKGKEFSNEEESGEHGDMELSGRGNKNDEPNSVVVLDSDVETIEKDECEETNNPIVSQITRETKEPHPVPVEKSKSPEQEASNPKERQRGEVEEAAEVGNAVEMGKAKVFENHNSTNGAHVQNGTRQDTYHGVSSAIDARAVTGVPVSTNEQPGKDSQEFFDFARDNVSSFIVRDVAVMKLCRVAIVETHREQTTIEFGNKFSSYQFAPQRRKSGRPPLGPILSLEAGQHVDSDQLWEEIELRNKPLLAHAYNRLQELADLSASAKESAQVEARSGELGESNDRQANSVEAVPIAVTKARTTYSDSVSDGEKEGAVPKSPKRRVRFTADVDSDLERKAKTPGIEDEDRPMEDGFFSVADMQRFADDAASLAEAGKLMASDDESEGSSATSDDIMREDDHDESLPGLKDRLRYTDFFDPPTNINEHGSSGKASRVSKLLDATDVGEEGAVPTPLDVSRTRMRRTIEAIEEENIGKKPWQLRGEVTGHSRPKDSLLDATMEHDIASKPKTILDPEVSRDIEDVIRQRIVDGLFDDVVKALPEEYEAEKRSKRSKDLPEVSQEKAKEGLGDLYAREFMAEKKKQLQDALASTEVQQETDEPESVEQAEVNRLYDKLSWKLDALASLHFTPTSAKMSTEMQVSANVKALAAEEAIPEAVSDRTLLTPREVYSVDKKELVGEQERTKEERKASRRKTKSGIRKEKRAKRSKDNVLVQTNPLEAEKRKAETALARRGKKVKTGQKVSSATMFEQPADNVAPVGMKRKAVDAIKASELAGKTPRKPAAHLVL